MVRPKRKNVIPDRVTRASKRRMVLSDEEVEQSEQELANLIVQVTVEAATGASLAAVGASFATSPSAAKQTPLVAAADTSAASPTTSVIEPCPSAAAEDTSVVVADTSAAVPNTSTAASSSTAGGDIPSFVGATPTAAGVSTSAATLSHSTGRDSPSAAEETPTVVIIRYDEYDLETPGFLNRGESGDLGIKSEMRKFADFKKNLVDEDLERFFRSMVFGKYLDVGVRNTPRFQMKLMYQLLRRWIRSENDFWINFCGMLVCFSMKQFAVVTGLNYHLPPPPTSQYEKVKRRYNRIVDAMQQKKHCKSKEMLDLLKSSNVKKSVKKSMCLVYFVHEILMGKDPGTNAMDYWFELSADRKAFCAYPWGRDRYVFPLSNCFILSRRSSGNFSISMK